MMRRVVLVDAHRGASVSHPENTLAAFRAALEVAADSVEFDVQLSSDGEPVVIHDETVDRTTGSTGEVCLLTLAELRALDAGSWRGERFAGERIPTLEETLDVLAGAPRINMELKAADPRLSELAADAIERRRLHHRIQASSFHVEHLVAVKRRLPGIWTHLFLDRPLEERFWEQEGRFVNSLGIPADYVTGRIVARAGGLGRAVWAFTVDDPDQALELAAMGVAAITTNDPAGIAEALRHDGYR